MATDDPAETTLAGLGEFAVIDRLVAGRDQPAAVALGPGDDAAVLFAADGRTVVSTDMLVAGRHFRLDWSSPHRRRPQGHCTECRRYRGHGSTADRLRRRIRRAG